MSVSHNRPAFVKRNIFRYPVVLFLLLAVFSARAQTRDEQYVAIFDLIQQADMLNSQGKTNAATTKYRKAQQDLLNFHNAYPDATPKAVAFRLSYVAEKLAAPTEQQASAPELESTARPPTASAANGPLKLIEAGAEPRKTLRLHPKAGDHQTLALTVKMDMGIKMGEIQNQSMKLPPMKMTMELNIKDVSEAGDIAYESTMSGFELGEEPGTMPQVAEAMKAALGGLQGMKGSGTISSRGFSKGTELKMPPGADPQMRQAMEQMRESLATMAAALPEEPVGPGARWEVTQPVKSQGMTMQQTAHYELVSFDGDRLSAKTTVTQRAANQKITNPAMPGLKVNLVKMEGHGAGTLTLDLSQLLPQEAAMESQSDMAMRVDAAGQNQAMTLHLDLNLRIDPK